MINDGHNVGRPSGGLGFSGGGMAKKYADGGMVGPITRGVLKPAMIELRKII